MAEKKFVRKGSSLGRVAEGARGVTGRLCAWSELPSRHVQSALGPTGDWPASGERAFATVRYSSVHYLVYTSPLSGFCIVAKSWSKGPCFSK